MGTRSGYDSIGGGVFKTTDGGRSWSQVDTGLRRFGAYISALAVDPTEPSTVYAGTMGFGIYKTTDGGKNWMPSDFGIRLQEKSIIALSV